MNISFSHLITSFFTKHLASERGLSENTVASYSDCMKLLINYACDQCKVGPEALYMDMFTRELILAFLDYAETSRHNCEATRNQRLAAIKSFFSFLARTIPELMEVNTRIQAIRAKKQIIDRRRVSHAARSRRSSPHRTMTRFGIGRRTQLHADAAASRCPLSRRRITPHVFRHTIALHLIEAGNDVFLVRDWLGHADIATTNQYVEISIERKRAALEKVPPPTTAAVPEPLQWKSPNIIDFLTRLSRKQHYVAKKA